MFDELPWLSRALAAAGLTLLMATIGLLVAPSMQHRIAERGQDSPRVLAIATIFAAWALLPLSIALAFDVFIAMDRIAGAAWGAGSGAGFFVLAMLFWFGLSFFTKRRKQPMAQTKSSKPTPLEAQVEQLLTEAPTSTLVVPLSNATTPTPGGKDGSAGSVVPRPRCAPWRRGVRRWLAVSDQIFALSQLDMN